MPETAAPAHTPHDPRAASVERVLLIVLVLNLIVAMTKIVIGTAAGALSIRADGFHSLMDGASNGIGLVANRIAARPPDEAHPYGHRRFETLGALAIGVLLLFTAVEIVGGVIERLQTGETPQVSALTVGALVFTFVVNVITVVYQTRESRRLRSQILLADSANTRADLFVTLSVLVSIGLTALGVRWADPLAAILIVGLIGRAAWQILQQTGGVLVDTAPFSPARLTEIALTLPAIDGERVTVERARSRGSAEAALIDIDLSIAPHMTTEQTAAIGAALRQRLIEVFPGVEEVEVHFEPRERDAPAERAALIARAQADALGLSTHEVMLRGETLDLHVEVPPQETLAQAHARVSDLEAALRAAMPEIAQVITHIEPAMNGAPSAMTPHPDHESANLAARALTLLRADRRGEDAPAADWHDLQVTPLENAGEYMLIAHATLPAALTVEAAHARAEAAETRLRAAFPMLRRITIHTEPPEETA